MAYQFKTRSSSPHEECQKEMTLLREYNLALQKENQSRNQERKALQAEIQRLLRHEKQWKEKGALTKSVVMVTTQSKEYTLLKEQYTQLKTKYESLLIQNSSLTSKIITQDYTSSRITSFDSQRSKLNETIRKHEAKIATLQGKLLTCQRQLTEARNKQESTSSTITRQYQQSMTTIEELERQLRIKNDQISRMQNEAIIKEEQTKALQRSIDGYASKIDALSDQLARLQRTHKVETVRIVQREDPTLRSRIEQLSSLNAALTAENLTLRTQVEYMRELQRKSILLQETNQKLQNELRMSFEARDSASRLQLQEDRNLKEAVFALKAQLQQVRSFNQLVRKQNEELYAQLQMLKNTRHNHSRCQKCRHKHNKSRSKSPLPQEQRSKATFGETFSVFHSKLTKKAENHTSHCIVSASQSHAQFSTLQEGRNRPTTNSQANERYNDLQRKIQMLQSQNQTLKQKLVHEI